VQNALDGSVPEITIPVVAGIALGQWIIQNKSD
jgi:hypothetical protein